MAGPAGDYHRGEMDTHEQARTYAAFLALSKWTSVVLGAALLFLVLWFCTETGFLGSAISGAVLLVLGIVFLRSKPTSH